jgi:SOS response regulatory protein OraA/RecX
MERKRKRSQETMNNERIKDSLVACLLRQGFSLAEARKYLENSKLEPNASSSIRFFGNEA